LPRALASPAAERRQQAIDALLELAWVRTPSAIRTADVAERVGVSQPALFRHFPSKEALWCAALEHITSRSWQRMEVLSQDTALAPQERAAALLRSHALLVSQQPGVARLLLQELQSPEPSPGRAVVEQFLGRVCNRLAQLLHGAQPDDAELLAQALLAQLQGLVLQGLLAGDLTALPQRLDAVLPLLLPDLKPRGAEVTL
jgi:AcrR family transcriptional regulator